MKILFVGAYKDGSGWSKAALGTIAAMDSVGIDVVPRPAKLNNFVFKSPEWLDKLEAKSSDKYDAVIHYLPPDNLTYHKELGKNKSKIQIETKYNNCYFKND